MMFRIAVSLIAAVSLSLASTATGWAHSGGLDQFGCHTVSATGEYHCHNDDEEDVNWPLLLGVLGGLIVLGIVVAYIADDRDPYNLDEALDRDVGLGFRIVPFVNALEGDGVDLEFQSSPGTGFGIRTTTDQLPVDNPDRRRDGEYVGAFYRLKF